MKFSIIKNLKIWIICALVVIVAGFALLGFLGFNNPIDFKKGYEISVTVNQNYDGSGICAKNAVEEYFAEKGQTDVEYAMQVTDSGDTYIFKFEKLSGVKETDLTSFVNQKLTDKYGTDAGGESFYTATIKVDEVVPEIYTQVGWLALALGISAVAVFVYLFFTEKVASALSVILSSILSGVLFLALTALTRIPAYPFVGAVFAGACALACMLSAGTVNRYKEAIKLNPKADNVDVAEKVAKDSALRQILVLGMIVLVSLVFVAFGSAYLKFIGLQLIACGLAAAFASFIGTPIIWTALKKVKKK